MRPSVALLFLSALLHRAESRPTTFDRRQEGAFNVDAKLENLLIYVSTSGASELLGNLAVQALGSQQDLDSRLALKSSNGASGHHGNHEASSPVRYEVEDTQERSKEPYRVEIVRIDKDDDGSVGKAESLLAAEGAKGVKGAKEPKELLPLGAGSNSQDLFESSKLQDTLTTGARNGERNERSLRRRGSGRAIIQDLGKEDNRSEMENAEKSSNESAPILDEEREAEVEETKNLNYVADTGRPGQSLKKELSRKEHDVVPVRERDSDPVEYNASRRSQ